MRRHGIALCTLAGFIVASSADAALIGELERLSPEPVTFVQGVDFATFADNGNAAYGDITGVLATPSGDPKGNNASDFIGFPTGAIALIERGDGVFFSTKVNNAAAAGAVGAIIYNHLDGLPGGSLAAPTTIPALFIPRSLGLEFLSQMDSGPVVVHMSVSQAIPAPAALPGALALLAAAGACLRYRRRN